MSEVKRYESGVHYCSGDAMVREDDGYYVKYSDYAALKAERDALATENMALKGLVEERCWVYDCDVEGYRDAHDYLPETPATDAYANQLRADAIDDFGKYHNFSEKMFIQQEAKKYAANLRKENGNG